MKKMIVRFQRLLFIGMLLFTTCFSTVASAQNISETTLSILSYARWTTDTPTICVIDNNNISKEFLVSAQRNNYKFQINTISAAQLKLVHCDAVFFSNTTAATEQQLINSAMNKNLLSFSSSNTECEIGSVFCLYTSKEGRTLFKLNLDSLSRSKMHVDPRVLLLARNAE